VHEPCLRHLRIGNCAGRLSLAHRCCAAPLLIRGDGGGGGGGWPCRGKGEDLHRAGQAARDRLSAMAGRGRDGESSPRSIGVQTEHIIAIDPFSQPPRPSRLGQQYRPSLETSFSPPPLNSIDPPSQHASNLSPLSISRRVTWLQWSRARVCWSSGAAVASSGWQQLWPALAPSCSPTRQRWGHRRFHSRFWSGF